VCSAAAAAAAAAAKCSRPYRYAPLLCAQRFTATERELLHQFGIDLTGLLKQSRALLELHSTDELTADKFDAVTLYNKLCEIYPACADLPDPTDAADTEIDDDDSARAASAAATAPKKKGAGAGSKILKAAATSSRSTIAAHTTQWEISSLGYMRSIASSMKKMADLADKSGNTAIRQALEVSV
jgi:hypothetical protein